LVLILSVSIATIESYFSAMKIVKNCLRNNMGDEFLVDCLITYIEKRIVEKFDTNSMVDKFYDMKEQRAQPT